MNVPVVGGTMWKSSGTVGQLDATTLVGYKKNCVLIATLFSDRF
jgi:hypothetical protein